MSDQRKMRLTLTMVAIILFGLGMWLLWPMIGWRGTTGLVLILWSNNLEQRTWER